MQGRENDIITVRSRDDSPGYIDDLRRVNVRTKKIFFRRCWSSSFREYILGLEICS